MDRVSFQLNLLKPPDHFQNCQHSYFHNHRWHRHRCTTSSGHHHQQTEQETWVFWECLLESTWFGFSPKSWGFDHQLMTISCDKSNQSDQNHHHNHQNQHNIIIIIRIIIIIIIISSSSSKLKSSSKSSSSSLTLARVRDSWTGQAAPHSKGCCSAHWGKYFLLIREIFYS